MKASGTIHCGVDGEVAHARVHTICIGSVGTEGNKSRAEGS